MPALPEARLWKAHFLADVSEVTTRHSEPERETARAACSASSGGPAVKPSAVFGRRVRTLRNANRWTQVELARRWLATLGESCPAADRVEASRVTIGQIERSVGGRQTTLEEVVTLARALGVSPDLLVADEDHHGSDVWLGDGVVIGQHYLHWWSGQMHLPGPEGGSPRRPAFAHIRWINGHPKKINEHEFALGSAARRLVDAITADDMPAALQAREELMKTADGLLEIGRHHDHRGPAIREAGPQPVLTMLETPPSSPDSQDSESPESVAIDASPQVSEVR